MVSRTLAGTFGGGTGYQETYQEVAGSLVKNKVTARILCGWRPRPASEKANDLLLRLGPKAEAAFSYAEQALVALQSSQQCWWQRGRLPVLALGAFLVCGC